MGTIMRVELRKMLIKKRIFIVWVVVLFLSYISINSISIKETYAEIFSTGWGLTPLMGLLMFMIVSGAYTSEYSSNMGSLIKTTKNGRRKLVIGKGIAAGVGVSIINLSIFLIVCLSGLTKFNFEGLDLPLKTFWYFGKSGSDITVLQMILVMIVTIIIGSFFFAQVGLFLSSISKSAAVPFIFGGLIMGMPYVAQGFLKGEVVKGLGLTPLWGMMSCQLIRYKVPVMMLVIGFVIMGGGILLLPKFTLKAFLKDEL